MYDYEGTRRVVYGGEYGATFVAVCSKCGRFVKAPKSMKFNIEGAVKLEPNATCKRCGLVEMIFEGYF